MYKVTSTSSLVLLYFLVFWDNVMYLRIKNPVAHFNTVNEQSESNPGAVFYSSFASLASGRSYYKTLFIIKVTSTSF